MKKIILLLFVTSPVWGQQLTDLTVEKIMRDPKWMGVSPSEAFWSEDSKTVYFNWNPTNAAGDSLYAISIANKVPQKVSPKARRSLPSVNGSYSKSFTKKVYEKYGDIFLLDIPTNKNIKISNTIDREFAPRFSQDESKIFFTSGNNLYSWTISSGAFSQLTDFRKDKKKGESKTTAQEEWLKQDQLAHMQILKERSENKKAAEKINKANRPDRPHIIYLNEQSVDHLMVSPNENFITYRITKEAKDAKSTIVPNYVTESGFTEDIPGRTKVGVNLDTYEFWIYDIKGDTTYRINTDGIPGITDKPDYVKDYPNKPSKENTTRPVVINGPYWSDDGKNNFVVVRAADNKDRWIMSLDLQTRQLKNLDRQRDEAWIGGPGIGYSLSAGNSGWLGDNKRIWFQSEETGYSHLYTVDITNGKKQSITSGSYEVQTAQLSKDKKYFYITTNEVHPGEKHFYKISVDGGKAEQLTTTSGGHQVVLSPDEKWMADLYSYSNKPWELFLTENKTKGKSDQITKSTSSEFNSYPWKDPEIITFKARDGAEVYARLYQPKALVNKGPAVIFVHGAGYLQNAHKWWSSYFREYMFHNMLVDKGYTVIDVDYRGSAGYGRDWRTGIYRFMGGKDLTDQIDAAKLLVDKYNVDSKRIGVYGGSYGGFITLMGLFTTPDVFAAGAALRPVTDWAHYNHGYTSNILNLPYTDSIAYAKSSPIYHAEGLKGALLICHGMVDTNVNFQDAVRLSQRLIELGKDNWELAVYPMENHGFVEPSSWTDEYKRIFKLSEDNLKP
ncbi:MAG: S9 family peptidase [Cyclobacteriaceae bacterium]|nr:S9 family peptidase [Cyclobacteriaceae bacterium]